jgi:nucleotide-binding universal stress UspA family protein
MQTHHLTRTILVPILGDDITEQALMTARSLIAQSDTHLVLLHVARAADSITDDCDVPQFPTIGRRWRRLASAAPARTFLEAVVGNPAEVVLSEARRFGSDTIVLGEPARGTDGTDWIDRAIHEIVRSAPTRIRVMTNLRRPLPMAPLPSRAQTGVALHLEA